MNDLKERIGSMLYNIKKYLEPDFLDGGDTLEKEFEKIVDSKYPKINFEDMEIPYSKALKCFRRERYEIFFNKFSEEIKKKPDTYFFGCNYIPSEKSKDFIKKIEDLENFLWDKEDYRNVVAKKLEERKKFSHEGISL